MIMIKIDFQVDFSLLLMFDDVFFLTSINRAVFSEQKKFYKIKYYRLGDLSLLDFKLNPRGLFFIHAVKLKI